MKGSTKAGTKGFGLAVIGAQWGDEGKGKIVHTLAEQSDLVVRFQGGHNAGHTVVTNGKKFKLHLVPSGVIAGKRSLIGAGVVIDPRALKREINELAAGGIRINQRILGIDYRASVIMPWHPALDEAREHRQSSFATAMASGTSKTSGSSIGTTKRGIGPAYEDRAARIGLVFADLIDAAVLKEKVFALHRYKQRFLHSLHCGLAESPERVYAEYAALGREFALFACDAASEASGAVSGGARVLFEGAQGTFLDVSFGTYPFVTSSNTIAGGACVGAGVPPRAITRVEGVAKAYTTRVGNGPFPTELFDAIGKHLQEKGAEFGTSTGRRRRCGWLDATMLRRAHQLNGFDGIHLTKLDVLDGLRELKIAVAHEVGGKRLREFPIGVRDAQRAKPIYEKMKGFSRVDWRRVVEEGRKKGFDALPSEARAYVSRIESLVGVPIMSVSVGAGRDDIIFAK
ncbi:MAG: adenylosuccinate synthase [Candidatus Micrarchaeota archaeon]